MPFVDLNRSFLPIENEVEAALDFGWPWGHKYGRWIDWPDLLGFRRVVPLAEAASGKTAEFRPRAWTVASTGRSAFFATIEDLADEGVTAALEPSGAMPFGAWRANSPGANATDGWFFLDSVDEARLNAMSLERALRRFARDVGPALERARVFVSCRASDWRWDADRGAILRILPAPERAMTREPGEEREMGFLAPLDAPFHVPAPRDRRDARDPRQTESWWSGSSPSGARSG